MGLVEFQTKSLLFRDSYFSISTSTVPLTRILPPRLATHHNSVVVTLVEAFTKISGDGGEVGRLKVGRTRARVRQFAPAGDGGCEADQAILGVFEQASRRMLRTEFYVFGQRYDGDIIREGSLRKTVVNFTHFLKNLIFEIVIRGHSKTT